MSATLADVVAVLERAYPPELAESWDAVGLVCGDPEETVRRVLVCVDPVESTVDEALAIDAQLVVAHHPLLLRGVHGVPANTPKGSLVHRLVRAGTGLFCAHTNADAAAPGVSDALAAALGVTVLSPLRANPDGRTGIGRIGELPAAEPLADFVRRVANALPATAGGVRAAGDPARPVRRVAVSGGAGDGYLDLASEAGVDVFVTADLRHHPAGEHLAHPGRPALVDVAHWASEWPWCEQAAGILREALGGTVDIVVSVRRTDPWTVASVPGSTGRMPG
ncbi:Nif3-like dinuclear metal center hexameric protein [Actinophytocola xanthii]|uniref:GTP cyclohydrolase 1 type 2 homolog n=1 Tax=Actinophytocola xanthii TaxID=1912961 RepID=A0A1Q8C3I6_9PSEU|nr:Nif3-like dinuclear metal center hexameric protein [Actinophytocola xanthii]OLF08913.1 Nif3-like dinuclear metal center hexameric protein [Actinophytocola xanthii]